MFASSCKRLEALGLAPGDNAPPFTVVDLEGKDFDLQSLKGKTVLLNFWAPWCAPCVQEMPELETLSKKLAPKGLVVVGVAVDEHVSSIINFQKKAGLSFLLVVDGDRNVSNSYKVKGYPESFFIDKDGKVVLFHDPETGDATVRIVGPRSWSSTEMISTIEAFL